MLIISLKVSSFIFYELTIYSKKPNNILDIYENISLPHTPKNIHVVFLKKHVQGKFKLPGNRLIIYRVQKISLNLFFRAIANFKYNLINGAIKIECYVKLNMNQ